MGDTDRGTLPNHIENIDINYWIILNLIFLLTKYLHYTIILCSFTRRSITGGEGGRGAG